MDYENEILAHSPVTQQHSAFRWTKKIIESSFNSYHLECCKKLIELFKEKYNNDHLAEELEAILYRKSLMILMP